MSEVRRCDVSGAICEDGGVRNFDVPVGEDAVLRVNVFSRKGKDLIQGEVAQAVAALVIEAIKKALEKKAQKKD